MTEDDRQPCGESHCICYGQGSEHYDCACGCDCPRDDDGELLPLEALPYADHPDYREEWRP